MSVVYCEYCDEYVDTDFNLEHFEDDLVDGDFYCATKREDEQ